MTSWSKIAGRGTYMLYRPISPKSSMFEVSVRTRMRRISRTPFRRNWPGPAIFGRDGIDLLTAPKENLYCAVEKLH